MKKSVWILVIVLLILVGSLIFKVGNIISRTKELGRSQVSFNFSIRDTSYLMNNTIREIGTCFTMHNKKGRESAYWLKDGSVIFISNILLPQKLNFLKEFELIEAKGGSKEYAVKDFSTGFKGGEFFATVTESLTNVSYCYFQKDGKLETKLRNEDSLHFEGNPGFLNLTNKINDKGTLGVIFKNRRKNVEVLFTNTKSEGVTMFLYLPSLKSKQNLRQLLK